MKIEHDTPEAIAITDTAARELIASEKALQVKHTPAPWTMGDENNQCCNVVLGVEHNLTCSLDRQDANTGDFVITRNEMLANAHLISAAPELLKALKRIELDARVARPYVGQTARLGEIARDAITKATGEQS